VGHFDVFLDGYWKLEELDNPAGFIVHRQAHHLDLNLLRVQFSCV
jgi:hypothetical protein